MKIIWSVDLEGGVEKGKEKGRRTWRRRRRKSEEEEREVAVIASFGSASLELQRWPRPVGLVQWKSTIRTLHSVMPSSL